MTRIIAGSARGRRLAVPSAGTRPTSDRVREALFSTIESDLLASDRSWSQVRVLDVFAGTGAFGLEALSRGAAGAVMVEKARAAVRTLEANVAAVGCAGGVVVVRDARQLAATAPSVVADICFADPPYDWAADDVRALLAGIHEAGWLSPGALVVAERPAKDPVSPLPPEWTDERRRPYGDTVLWYGRPASTQEPQPRASDSPIP